MRWEWKKDEKVENVEKSFRKMASPVPWRSTVTEHLIDFIHRKRKPLLTDLTDFITSWTELRRYLPPVTTLPLDLCIFKKMGRDHFKVVFQKSTEAQQSARRWTPSQYFTILSLSFLLCRGITVWALKQTIGSSWVKLHSHNRICKTNKCGAIWKGDLFR